MMTYEQARAEALKIAGESFFTMTEIVPSRPHDYCKPRYHITIVLNEIAIDAEQSSWEKAIQNIKEKMEPYSRLCAAKQ